MPSPSPSPHPANRSRAGSHEKKGLCPGETWPPAALTSTHREAAVGTWVGKVGPHWPLLPRSCWAAGKKGRRAGGGETEHPVVGGCLQTPRQSGRGTQEALSALFHEHPRDLSSAHGLWPCPLIGGHTPSRPRAGMCARRTQRTQGGLLKAESPASPQGVAAGSVEPHSRTWGRSVPVRAQQRPLLGPVLTPRVPATLYRGRT